MIVNDKNEVQPCRLLPRDIGWEAFFFSALPIHTSFLCVSISLSRMERNGTEQNGLELKNRLLNFVGTILTKFLLNLFLFRWVSMIEYNSFNASTKEQLTWKCHYLQNNILKIIYVVLNIVQGPFYKTSCCYPTVVDLLNGYLAS